MSVWDEREAAGLGAREEAAASGSKRVAAACSSTAARQAATGAGRLGVLTVSTGTVPARRGRCGARYEQVMAECGTLGDSRSAGVLGMAPGERALAIELRRACKREPGDCAAVLAAGALRRAGLASPAAHRSHSAVVPCRAASTASQPGQRPSRACLPQTAPSLPWPPLVPGAPLQVRLVTA